MTMASAARTGPASGVMRPSPVADPELRLILLHHAGGSRTAFRRWARYLPPAYDTCIVEAIVSDLEAL